MHRVDKFLFIIFEKHLGFRFETLRYSMTDMPVKKSIFLQLDENLNRFQTETYLRELQIKDL